MGRLHSIETHAIDNLRFIRETMERSNAFTAVPGRAGVLMGLTAIVAAWAAARQSSRELWLATWMAEGMIAVAIGAWGVLDKAQRTGASLTSTPARKFALGFAPPIVVGAVLTAALWRMGLERLLPGIWIMLYGAAIMTGGSFSVRPVPAMGSVLVLLGAVTMFVPAAWADAMLGLAFGVVQIVFGIWLARRFGG